MKRTVSVGVLVLAIASIGIGFAQAQEVCWVTNLETQCVGDPSSGTTTLDTRVGCCVTVRSTGAVSLGETGVIGNGVEGLSATLIVKADGTEAARTTVSGGDGIGTQTTTLAHTVTTDARPGCCVTARVSGSIVNVGQTGVVGGTTVQVWVNGQRVL